MAGINETLYGKDNIEKLLSQEDIMNIFNIKDSRTLKKIIREESFPYVIINGRIYTEPSQYQKWLKHKYVNRY